MPYVERREGLIVGLYAILQEGYAEEWLPDDDIEVLEYLEPEIPIIQQILGPISAATFSISAGEVAGIETSINFGAAFMADTDTYWAFFTNPEPDANYLVLGNVPFIRGTEFIEFVAADLSEVSLTTWRVKSEA